MKSIDLIKPQLFADRKYIIFGLLSLILVDLMQLVIPRVIKWAVDDLTLYGIGAPGLAVYGGYLAGIGILIGAFRYVWRRCLMGTARRVEESLRNQLFAHIQTLSAGYFDKITTGDLMAHATNDIQQVRMACGMGMVALNDAVILGTAAIGFMVYIHLTLTLYVLIPMPFIVLGTRFFSRRMHQRYLEVQGAFSDLTESIRERFAGIRVIKAYACESAEAEKVEEISRSYIRKNILLTRITGSFFPMMLLFTNLSLFIVLYLGGRQTIYAEISPGDFVAFISYLGLLTWPMMALGWVTNLVQRGRASLNRLNRILQTPAQIGDTPQSKALPGVEGRLQWVRVRFSYNGQHNPALNELDVTVASGGVLGVVGPPGSGKTTLLSLIPRLYDVSDGAIRLDGMDIRSVKVKDLRSHIAYAPQEPFLFSGTIRENITFGDPNVDEETLLETARRAAVDQTILSFPRGFETVVGEKGIILSGGQKQRIVLARAILKDAPVMVLDDPISQVDTHTGNTIVKTLRGYAGQKTLVIASHRLSAVRFADHIVVLDQGRIIESGNHDRLMAQNGYYAKTYRMQELEDAR